MHIFLKSKVHFVSVVMVADQSKLTELDKLWIPVTLGSFGYLRNIPAEDVQAVGDKLKAIYLEGNSLTMDSLVNLFSDLAFNRGARLATELHSHYGSKVYPYMVTHEGGFSLALAMGQNRNGDSRLFLQHYFSVPTLALA